MKQHYIRQDTTYSKPYQKLLQSNAHHIMTPQTTLAKNARLLSHGGTIQDPL